MTTTIKVFAHCTPDKHVVITEDGGNRVTFLEDGEMFETVVYDNKQVTVLEDFKKKPE